jgi:carbamoyltransferase
MKKSIYVLGTAVSHNGSACLLKDGKICVAIEKERLTRKKHDGGNDNIAIDYCLKAEGITIGDVDLIVQNANFGSFKFGNDYFRGHRLFEDNINVPVVTISHHLAHAYSTAGTCPFEKFNVLVMDGCGNSFDDCMDTGGAYIPDMDSIRKLPHLYHEKDSYYSYSGDTLIPMVKDFSEWGYNQVGYALYPDTTMHSIGGVYSGISYYCFGNMNDPGKLMGLGPYGRPGYFKEEIFELKDGRVFVNYDWMSKYRNPARSYEDFKKQFQYYADIALGVQKEVERAVMYIVNSRLEANPAENLCYSGGTALNAVANAKILSSSAIKQIYIEPAAGDNGLSIGCAFYGSLEVLKTQRPKHNGSTCFGITYPKAIIKKTIESYRNPQDSVNMGRIMDLFFSALEKDETAHPGYKAVIQFNIDDFGVFQVHMNGSIKCESRIVSRPTCIVRTGAGEFYRILLDPSSLQSAQNTGRVEITNTDDLEFFLKNIDLENFYRLLEDHREDHQYKEDEPFLYTYSKDYIKDTAKLLAEGKIIGWFQDGSEFGPRALGRRSILADPRNKAARNFINAEIKFREDFRPFAPSVLSEDVGEYFKGGYCSPYMLLVDQIKDEYHDTLRSIVHEDRSSRVQTVTDGWNKKYYQLLKEFKKITGVSVLLNTSFNRRGMPIVETPKEAIDFFLSCKLDYLVMGQYIIGKRK